MKVKKKILMVVRWPAGGIRTFLLYVLKYFNQAEYHISILAPEREESSKLIDRLQQYENIIVCYISSGKNPSFAGFLKSVIEHIFTNDYDMIYSHGLTAGLCSLFPSLFKGVPHMVTSHDVFTQKQLSGPVGMLMKAYLSISLPLFNKIHLVSYGAQNNLFESLPFLRLFKKKIHVIQNGVEVERFLGDEKRDLRNELGLGDEYFLIGFLGRFMAQKGFSYLVEALSILIHDRNIQKTPVIIAIGSGGFVREERDSITRNTMDKYVYFLPFVENIAMTLRGLDIVAMPSRWDACPLLPMEAMVAGVPVIGTNCIGGLPETLSDTPHTIISPENSEALAKAIKNEINCSSREKTNDYRQIAAQRFDVRKQSEAIENLILEL